MQMSAHDGILYRSKPTDTTTPSQIISSIVMDRRRYDGRYNNNSTMDEAICIKLGRRGLNTYTYDFFHAE